MAEMIHLDSNIIRGLIDPEDEEKNNSSARHLINSSSGVINPQMNPWACRSNFMRLPPQDGRP